MKILSLFLCLCFTMNVFAASNLEEVFNDYEYSMTVEWDQKDMDFKNTATAKFYKEIETLGLTSAEIMKFAQTKVNDKNVLEAVKMKASQAHSAEELVSILNSTELYQQGASWNGRQVLVGGVVAAGIALFAYSIYFVATTGGCVEIMEDGSKKNCNE